MSTKEKLDTQRAIVRELVGGGVSERMGCQAVGLNRSTLRYKSFISEQAQQERERMHREVVELAHRHRRYGYRRVTAMLRRSGNRVNHKRVWRIWRSERLSLPRRRPRKRRVQVGAPFPSFPIRAEYRGHIWTYDFAFDRTERGGTLKMLIVLDEYTRECHHIKVARSLDSEAVAEILSELFELHGAASFLRSDNGGEFIANKLEEWLRGRGTQTIHIAPGHPWENGYAESFIGKFRDECLNEEVFWNERHAQMIVQGWRKHYNEERPHSSLDYRTPSEVAQAAKLAASARVSERLTF